MAPLKKKAAEIGLELGHLHDIYNTRLAQELGLWAESMNKGDEFHKSAFRAYLTHGKNIAKREVLLDLSESIGLPRAEAETVLEDRTFRDAVDKDWAEARQLNINAVPTVICNGRRLVGYQPYEKLTRLIRGGRL